MARVMIHCPETGKPVYTGMTFDWSAFENVRIGERKVFCPACGEYHAWKRTDAYLDEVGSGH